MSVEQNLGGWRSTLSEKKKPSVLFESRSHWHCHGEVNEITKRSRTWTTLFPRFVRSDALERLGLRDTFSFVKTPFVTRIKAEGKGAENEKEKSCCCGTNRRFFSLARGKHGVI